MTDRTISIVSWNIAKRDGPWSEMAEMAARGEADLALLQEAVEPPSKIADRFRYENDAITRAIGPLAAGRAIVRQGGG